MAIQTASPSVPQKAVWKKLVAGYQESHTWKSIWQIINSLLPFLGIWFLMYVSLDYSYWLTLALAFPAAGFIVRIFIIQHDCGHGSFFQSRRISDAIGMLSSLFTFVPYHYWKKGHAIHHANAGKLDHRGIGDIKTLTVDEYQQLPFWGKIKYRIYRNPFVLFTVSPFLLFVVLYRFPNSKDKSLKRIESSLYWTDLALVILVGGVIFLVGWQAFLMIQLPITIIASSVGTWLFYIQHQFEEAYWARNEQWDYAEAALQGSSYYKLPRPLQWFTGNIGYHHIHHLSPRIPNYHLEKCHKENPTLQNTVVLTMRSSVRSIYLSLWDDDQGRLISFRHLRRCRAGVAEK